MLQQKATAIKCTPFQLQQYQYEKIINPGASVEGTSEHMHPCDSIKESASAGRSRRTYLAPLVKNKRR